MNDISHQNCSVFKDAWHRVKGLKRHFWGGSFLVILMALGGLSALGALLLIVQSFFVPHFIELYQMNPTFYMDPTFMVPAGVAIVFLCYQIAVALYEMFIMLPMRMGLRLIPLRHVAEKPIDSLYVFKFITWKYIGRFVALSVLIVLAVGIPAGVGLGLLCLPGMYHLGMLLHIVCYVIGILLILCAIYLSVCYAFVNLLVIDRDISAWKAMGLSRHTVEKRWFCIFGTLVLLGIILALSAVVFIVGLIWTVPFA